MNRHKIALLFVVIIVLTSPFTAMSAVIKSTKVLKAGTPEVVQNQSTVMMNYLFKGMRQENPYFLRRPAIIRVTFTCDKTPNKPVYLDLETYQAQDKWGEWVADNDALKDVVFKRCGEETAEEKAERVRMQEKAKAEKEQAIAEKARVLEQDRLFQEEEKLRPEKERVRQEQERAEKRIIRLKRTLFHEEP